MTHASRILEQFKMAAADDDLPLAQREKAKATVAERDDREPPTAEELMAEFDYEPGEPPNPIHGEVTDELDRYGYPYIFMGSAGSHKAHRIWKDKLDRAGYRYHHPLDDRFGEGVDRRIAVVTGRPEAED